MNRIRSRIVNGKTIGYKNPILKPKMYTDGQAQEEINHHYWKNRLEKHLRTNNLKFLQFPFEEPVEDIDPSFRFDLTKTMIGCYRRIERSYPFSKTLSDSFGVNHLQKSSRLIQIDLKNFKKLVHINSLRRENEKKAFINRYINVYSNINKDFYRETDFNWNWIDSIISSSKCSRAQFLSDYSKSRLFMEHLIYEARKNSYLEFFPLFMTIHLLDSVNSAVALPSPVIPFYFLNSGSLYKFIISENAKIDFRINKEDRPSLKCSMNYVESIRRELLDKDGKLIPDYLGASKIHFYYLNKIYERTKHNISKY